MLTNMRLERHFSACTFDWYSLVKYCRYFIVWRRMSVVKIFCRNKD